MTNQDAKHYALLGIHRLRVFLDNLSDNINEEFIPPVENDLASFVIKAIEADNFQD